MAIRLIFLTLYCFMSKFVNASPDHLTVDRHLVLQLAQRMANLEKKVDNREVIMSSMNALLEEQHREIVSLRKQLTQHLKEAAPLSESSHGHEIHIPYDKSKQFQNIGEGIKTENGTGEMESKESVGEEYMDTEPETMKRSLMNRRALRSSSPAFYAYMSSHEYSPGKDHTIIFRSSITNVGNAYNRHTGIFTASVSGIYVFSYTISADSSAYLHIEFMKNSAVMGSTLARSNGSYRKDTSATFVLQLSAGDVCYVRTSSTYSSSGNIFSSAESRSSFSGWLLF